MLVFMLRTAGRSRGGRPAPKKQAGDGGAVLALIIVVVLCIAWHPALYGVVPLSVLSVIVLAVNWPHGKARKQPDPPDELLASWGAEGGQK